MYLSTSLTRLILVSSAFLCLISCAEEEKDPAGAVAPSPVAETRKNSESVPQVSSEQSSFGANYFKATVIENSEPNSYEVQITWVPFKGVVRVLDQSNLVRLVAGDQAAVALPVVGGRLVNLTIEGKKDSQTEAESYPISMQIPKDFVVGGAWTLSENTKIDANRVFLQGATITTLNYSFVVNAKNFKSENTVIQNFETNAKAPREMNGRHGGAVGITADRAQGHLSVILRGEDGGDGKIGKLKGSTFMDTQPLICPGTNGGKGGNAGSLVVIAKEGTALVVNSKMELASGGVGGIRGGYPSANPDDYISVCDYNAPNGVNGTPGLPGKSCVKYSSEQAPDCQK